MVVAALINHPVRFQAGRLLMTAGVNALVEQGDFNPLPYLRRHLQGDWGDLPPEDARLNQAALRDGDRLLSAYQVNPDLKLWIITEADRSATTVLLPEEY
jgi:hypothetical protein